MLWQKPAPGNKDALEALRLLGESSDLSDTWRNRLEATIRAALSHTYEIEKEMPEDFVPCEGWMLVGRVNGTVEHVKTAETLRKEHTYNPATHIKPLEWEQCRDWRMFTASTPFGQYRVEQEDNGQCKWGYCFNEYYDEETFECESIDDGKQKAWDNWLKRITPALLAQKTEE
jgi:hypothetical protein